MPPSSLTQQFTMHVVAHRDSAELNADNVLGWALVLGNASNGDVRLPTGKIDRMITDRNVELYPRVLNSKLRHCLRYVGNGHGGQRQLNAPAKLGILPRHLPLRLRQGLFYITGCG